MDLRQAIHNLGEITTDDPLGKYIIMYLCSKIHVTRHFHIELNN